MASKCRLWNLLKKLFVCSVKGHDWRFVKEGQKGRYVYECDRCGKDDTRKTRRGE